MSGVGDPTLVTITPVSPPGYPIPFSLLGDSTMQQATGGTGGWIIVDRPRLIAATQWYDRSPWELDLPVRLDSQYIFGEPGQSIEAYCGEVLSWMDKAPFNNQAPVLSITGPITGIQYNWVVYEMTFDEAIRAYPAGYRTQQDIKLTLYEYNAPLSGMVSSPSPAQQFFVNINTAEGGSSFLLYTVKQGDTLAGIAAALLNNYFEWTEIASLNNIRDPNSIQPGQILKIPSS